MHTLEVGKPYGIPRSRPEGFQVAGMSEERCEIWAVYNGLKKAEITQWRKQPLTMGLAELDDLAIFYFKDAISEGDAPFNIHMTPATERTPMHSLGLVQVILLSAENGTIHALRTCSISKEFQQEIARVTVAQQTQFFETAKYQLAVDVYMQKYDIKTLAKRTIIKEVLGAI